MQPAAQKEPETISTDRRILPVAPRPAVQKSAPPPPLSPAESIVHIHHAPVSPVKPPVQEIRVIVEQPPALQPAQPEVQYKVLKQPESAAKKEVQPAPKISEKPVEKVPEKIADFIAIPPQTRNKPAADDAIKNAIKPAAIRHTKPLPILKGKAGRVHSDEQLDDILKTMLRDGKAPYGKPRQQYNYRSHVRLADLADELVKEGGALHGNFKGKDFWGKWSLATGIPLQASFYRKFA